MLSHLIMYNFKRIAFGKDNYLMRINNAVLDWNENIVDQSHLGNIENV